MGLFAKLARTWRSAKSVDTRRLRGLMAPELVEKRCVLSATPIQVGAVYVEQDAGSDSHGDLFEITFRGGAPHTQLRRVIIDGDQNIVGFGVGDNFFDISETGFGADHAFNFLVESQQGIDQVRATVEDGSTRLILDFVGFDAGEHLRFSIDVDEVEAFDLNETDLSRINEGFDPITSGVEFQGTQFQAEFTAPHFFDATATSTFRNRYDDLLIPSGLPLPADDFGGRRDRSAGAFASVTQVHVPASISGYVFHDQDNDGIRDPGERGIAGISIRVVPLESVIPQSPVTITTDAQGFYRATGLVAGRYRVLEVSQPAGYLDGKDSAGTVSGQRRGLTANDQIDDIRLDGGEAGLEYNFGELLPVTIRGHVQLSTREGDCDSESIEHAPVVGARVQLFDAAGDLVAETVTNGHGEYEFTGLRPGTYRVVEITPPGLLDGGPHVGRVDGVVTGVIRPDGSVADIVIGSGKVGTEYDFCEHLPASISGFVYHDRDDNGRRVAGEEGIAGTIVRLLNARGDEVARTATDQAGHYQFRGLYAGTYSVVEVQPATWTDGLDSAGTVLGVTQGVAVNPGDRIQSIRLLFGDEGLDYNFGEIRPATLQGRVHLATREGDCFTESIHHEPVVGAIVRLFGANGSLLAETRSDAEGNYEFRGLRPGTYRIVELTPEGLIDGGAQAGKIQGVSSGNVLDAGTITDIVIRSDQLGVGYDFCEFPPGTLAGNVYHDRDQNGRREAGDEGIAGAIVRLLDRQGREVARATTDAQGRYRLIGLRAGSYTLVETQPVGWLDGIDTAGTIEGVVVGRALNPGDRISQVDLLWGDDGQEYNFGEYLGATIDGRVQLATREGDCFGAIEDHPPVPNAIVRLFDQQGTLVAETRTDAAGRYRFSGLAPGTYRVVELTPAGLIDGGAQAGTVAGRRIGRVLDPGTIADLVLRSADVAVRYDFCEFPPAVIGGWVYHDGNDNGRREPGEEPVADVLVELVNDRGIVVASTRTDGQGFYQLRGLRSGTYTLRETQPIGWLDGKDTPGLVLGTVTGTADYPGDAIRQIFLGWGDVGTQFNFGELLAGSIEGIVHTDILRDCKYDPRAGEQLLANVTVELLDATGRVLGRTVTNAAGQYRFAGLRPGLYVVREVQPQGYFVGKSKAGSQGGDDSLPNEIRGVVVGSGQHLIEYNFCEDPPVILSGYVFQDGASVPLAEGAQLPDRIRDVRDGVLTPDDTRLPGVVLELRNGIHGLPITHESALPGWYPAGPIRVRTDAAGYYEFRGIRAGTYAVFEVHPEGYVDGVDTPGSAAGISFNPGEPRNEQALATLQVDPRNDAIVRITLPPAAVSRANNFSEVRTAPAAYLPPYQPPPLGRLPSTELPPSPVLPAPFVLNNYRQAPLGHVIGNPGPTWHLSIINAGSPRGEGITHRALDAILLAAHQPNASDSDSMSSKSAEDLSKGLWSMTTTYGQQAVIPDGLRLGLYQAIPVAGDFDGNGYSEIGVYCQGEWFIDLNANGQWDSGDLWVKLGGKSDIPVTGDWDGDGKTDIGIYGPRWDGDTRAIAHEPGLPDKQNPPDGRTKNVPPEPDQATDGYRVMRHRRGKDPRADLIDHVFQYGKRGDHPVVGDWNGDGIVSIGVFRAGRWYLDMDGNGRWTSADRKVQLGREGDQPLAGDFNADGVDELAIFRDGKLYLDRDGNGRIDPTDEILSLGGPGDRAVVGDWNGDGIDEVAVYRGQR